MDFVKNNAMVLSERSGIRTVEKFIALTNVVRTEEVRAVTLDHAISDLSQQFDFLKIDVQGAEKEVLLGAHDFLATNCLAIFIETYSVEVFQNQWLLSDVENYLHRFGFCKAIQYPSIGNFACSNDVLFIKEKITNPKLNTILKTYNLLCRSHLCYWPEFKGQRI